MRLARISDYAPARHKRLSSGAPERAASNPARSCDRTAPIRIWDVAVGLPLTARDY
jgi:hypothetical protein